MQQQQQQQLCSSSSCAAATYTRVAGIATHNRSSFASPRLRSSSLNIERNSSRSSCPSPEASHRENTSSGVTALSDAAASPVSAGRPPPSLAPSPPPPSPPPALPLLPLPAAAAATTPRAPGAPAGSVVCSSARVLAELEVAGTLFSWWRINICSALAIASLTDAAAVDSWLYL